MFTGIVDHTGRVESVQNRNQGVTLRINCGFSGLTVGESMGVNGVCLTLVDVSDSGFSVEVSPETLSKTAGFSSGELVNLERPLKVGDALGGHWVTGHIDTTATLISKESRGDFFECRFHLNSTGPIFEKGSIALGGVSLTVNRVEGQEIWVMIVPHTLGRTTFGNLTEGARINVEFDCLHKMVNARLEQMKLGGL